MLEVSIKQTQKKKRKRSSEKGDRKHENRNN